MVFVPKQIEQVVRGENGLLSAMGLGQIWVDMTTNQPALAKELANAIVATEAQAIDGPVTGPLMAYALAVCRNLPVAMRKL